MPHKERAHSRSPGHRGFGGYGPGQNVGKGPQHGWSNFGGVPVLTYFDGEGLGEQIRLTFVVGGVHFVDRRIKDHAEFERKFKQYPPHGQLPYLEVDGQMIVQSAAILHYAAKRAGLQPELAQDKDRALGLQGMLVELWSFGDAIPSSLPLQERRPRILDLMKEKGILILDRIESMINPSEDGWLFGNTISHADIMLHCVMNYMKTYAADFVAEGSLASRFPKILKVQEAVAQHPAIKRYRTEKAKRSYKPKLHYFNGEGVAGPIRWAFRIGNIDFEDIRFDFQDWPTIKPTIPGGVVPALQISDNEWLTESLACLIHVSRQAGLVPFTDSDYVHAYSIGLSMAPLQAILASVYRSEGEQRAENLRIATEETVPALLHRIEALVVQRQSAQGYCVGNRLSFADLIVANVFKTLTERAFGITISDLLTAYPAMLKVYKLVTSHPAVAECRKHGVVQTPKMYYFSVTGRGETIRQLFKHGNVAYEEVNFPDGEWSDVYKKESITGKAPWIDIGTTRIYETLACVHYAAERAGLIPHTWQGRATSLALFSSFNNVLDVYVAQYEKPDGPEREAIRTSFAGQFASEFEIVEKQLAVSQSTKGFAVDNQLSYIDFYLGHEINWLITSRWLGDNWTQTYPHLAKLHKIVMDLRK